MYKFKQYIADLKTIRDRKVFWVDGWKGRWMLNPFYGLITAIKNKIAIKIMGEQFLSTLCAFQNFPKYYFCTLLKWH